MDPEIVIEALCEGGRLRLSRVADGEGWLFFVESGQSTLIALLSEEDAGGLSPTTRSEGVRDFEVALALMDSRPWPLFHPVRVHRLYADRVLAAVRRGTPGVAALRRWVEACTP